MASTRDGAKRAADDAKKSLPERPDIAQRVLSYFQQNARAMDSVEGIARFWVHEDRDEVERCLLDLHACGLLSRRLIAGTAFFSLPDPAEAPVPEPSAPQPSLAPATPLWVAGSAAAAAGPSPAAASTGVAPAAARRTGSAQLGRILVVDDDNAVRSFLVEALTDSGHSVAAAADGERAIEMSRGQEFDLVLTDVMMPGISGLEVLSAIKQQSPATEVIVVTAHASLETAVKALRCGAYDLITKPLNDLETLDRVVARALEKRRLSADNRLLVENLQGRNLELTESVARLAAVNEVGKATAGLLDTEDLYDSLVRLVAQHLKARRVSILICEPDSDTMRLAASVGITDEDALKTRIRVGEGIAGRVALSQSPLLVADINKSDLKNLKGEGKYSTPSFMATPLMVAYPIRYRRSRLGVINVSDKHSGEAFTEQDLDFLATLAGQVAVVIENARLVREMEGGYLGLLTTIIRAAEDTRPETRGHSPRVTRLATAVARAMGLPEARVDLLTRAAALHEVGWFAERPETGDEPAGQVWSHAVALATERALSSIGSLRSVREIILHSADRFEDPEAPFAAARHGVPVESRILAACEEFVRLTPGDASDAECDRRALETLRREAGRRLDPEVLEALGRVAGNGEAR